MNYCTNNVLINISVKNDLELNAVQKKPTMLLMLHHDWCMSGD